ncbi:MAG: hypothetical protein AB2L14_26875 [Candidatus Xenobiia bacterium LiM19]
MYYRISVLLIAVLLLCVLSPLPSYAENDDSGSRQCTSCIKTLIQALELWSNGHQGKFPTKEEFASKAFVEYLKKASPATAGTVMKCPSSGKTYIYVPQNSQKSYIIRCATPEKHGAAIFCYSRDKGFIREEKVSTASVQGDAARNDAIKKQKTPAKPAQKPEVNPGVTQKADMKAPQNAAGEEAAPEEKEVTAVPREEKGVTPCTSRMMALTQGVELWSNSHKGIYPTSVEFSAKAFQDCYRKICKGNVEKEMKCPLSGKPYLFIPRQAEKSYIIKCPTPEAHGLGALYYSRDKGIVKEVAKEIPGKPGTVAARPSVPGQKVPEKPVKTQKKPGKTDDAEPSSFVSKDSISREDREKIISLITDLYNAYADKSLDRILEIQHDAIEASAIDYEKRKKGSADEVRDAFKDATKEIIEHKDYKLLPLNLSDISIARTGKFYKVTSVVPIIATDRLEVQEEGKYFFVRLRIGEMIFEKSSEDSWKIVNMYLY